MKLLEYRTMAKSRSEFYEFIPMGDFHEGVKNCDEKKLQKTVDYIKDRPHARTMLMGDLCECINYTDKRFDPDNVHPRYHNKLSNLAVEQANWVINLLKPIKDKIICSLDGNHEEKIRLRFHNNVGDYIAMSLGVPNLGYVGMVRWHFCRNGSNGGSSINIYATHGNSSGKTAMRKLIGMSGSFEADIYLMAHCHYKEVKPGIGYKTMTKLGEPRLVDKKKFYGLTGSFFDTYKLDCKSYGEKAMYEPTPTGVIKFKIEPFLRRREGNKQWEEPVHIHGSA